MKPLVFAGNWKMHLGPGDARRYLDAFMAPPASGQPGAGREIWFFPSSVALEAVAAVVAGRPGFRVGAQNIHWEDHGAFTGEVSAPMVRQAGANLALVGHSERRHVFGETDEQTARKVSAALRAGVTPVLCVGETLDQREQGLTLTVVERQLTALAGLSLGDLARVVVAYEPVWAIGTGRNATPGDAAKVHASIRRWFVARGASGPGVIILYGGSVKSDNVRSLLAEPEIDGVLVGGASLDPVAWGAVTTARPD